MKNWPPILWAVFFGLIILLGGILIFLFDAYKEFGLEQRYFLWIVLVVLYFYYRSIGSVDMHIHHYNIGIIFMTLIGYQSAFSTIVHGIMNGIFIEGVTRYNYGPIWIYKYEDISPRILKII